MSIEERNGQYVARWRTADGKQRQKTFAGKRAAQQHLATITAGLAQGRSGDPAPGRMRFAEWVDVWRAAPGFVRDTTPERDESMLRTHVLPRFGRMRLCDIRRENVRAWVEMLTRTGTPGTSRSKPLAPSTVHKCHGVLSKILEAAVDAERIDSNPARGTKLPKIPDEEKRFLSPDELVALEDAVATVDDRQAGTAVRRGRAPGTSWAVLVPFLADTGLRIGEALALTWADVNPLKGVVHVRRGSVEVGGEVRIHDTKSRAGRRTVPTLTHEVGLRLHERRGDAADTDLVFLSPEGRPARARHLRDRMWMPALEIAGLEDPQPTFHSLRHTAIAHWIEAGVEPYRVAKYAGHRSIATVYRLYGHLLDLDAEAEREALSRMRQAAQGRRQSATVHKVHTAGG